MKLQYLLDVQLWRGAVAQFGKHVRSKHMLSAIEGATLSSQLIKHIDKLLYWCTRLTSLGAIKIASTELRISFRSEISLAKLIFGASVQA